MLRLSIHRAQPGMTLAVPILHPDKPEHVLLKPGAVLDSTTIERLVELNVRQLCIAYPPTAYLMRCVSPSIIAEQGRLASRVSDCIDAATSAIHADFDFLEYLTGLRSLMMNLINDPAAATFVEDIVDSPRAIVGHSFNVGLLSLLMGLKLDGYLIANRRRVSVRRAQNVENLGVGGILHDIGVLALDRGVVQRGFRSAEVREPDWCQHVTEGYRILRGKVAPTAAAAVLNHHQRLDGSGYPVRAGTSSAPTPMVGRGIHIFSRIVAVADVFDRLRRPPEEPGVVVPTVRALAQTLAQVRKGQLDPVVFRALLSVVPAFAPGSVVKLNDERSYVVTAWHPEQPCRPTVNAISTDALGLDTASSVIGPPLDLRVRPALRVVAAQGESVRDDLFAPLFGGEFDLRTPYPHGLVEPTSQPEPVRTTNTRHKRAG